MFGTSKRTPVQGFLLAALAGTRNAICRAGGLFRHERACFSPGILNSATLSGGPVVVPGEFIMLTGFGIAPDSETAYQPGASGPYCAADSGRAGAGAVCAIAREINALLPVELSGHSQTSTFGAPGHSSGGSPALRHRRRQ